MFQNYLKVALRNLWKNKTFSFINLFGLSIAFATSFLLFLISYQEFTYNGMHENAERINRFYLKVNLADETKYGSAAPAPLRNALLEDYKNEIEHVTRIEDKGLVIKYNNKTIEEEGVAVDADYLHMFSFEFLKGSPETALEDLNSIVLREDVAKNIFGNEEAMGKMVAAEIGGKPVNLKVTGITAKLPDNTSIENQMMFRYELSPEYTEHKDNWNHSSSQLYLMLKEGVDKNIFEKNLLTFCNKYYKSNIEQLKLEGGKPDDNGNLISAHLLPFLDEHFDKKIGGGRSVSIVYPYTLITISIFILFIACINFVNLNISRSILRSKEVGIRKALGALKGQVIGQFWGEALIICTLSLLLGLLIFNLCVTPFNAMFNSKLNFSMLFAFTPFLILMAAFLFITFIAGGYPAWFIAKINTIDVLKGSFKTSGQSSFLKKALIVKQFTISVLLICCTIIIWNQLDYLKSKPLGYNKEQVISIPVGGEIDGERMLNILKSKLSGQTNILNITAADNNLGYGKDHYASKSQFGFLHEGKTVQTNALFVDFDYVKTMNMKIKEGRDFSIAFPGDSTKSCIINESMAKKLGGKDLIGKTLALNEGMTVIGVIEDYHFESLKNNIEPLTLMVKGFPYTHIFAKIAPQNTDASLALLQKEYKSIAPNSEYLGSFIDENTTEQYRTERRFTNMFIYAAILAILLSCMGLFAIALISITQRIKEIGIRKVLGSSVSGLVWNLNGDFLKLVLLSIIIASPIAYCFMDNWLSDFAYRVNIQWPVFVAAGLLALVIAFLTISYHSVSAAMMNPVKSLRSE